MLIPPSEGELLIFCPFRRYFGDEMTLVGEENYALIENQLECFIRDKCKDKPVLIGLSGGIDSSLVCFLAVKALGKDKVKGLVMNNLRFFSGDLIKAREFAKSLGVKLTEVGTNEVRETLIGALKVDESNIVEVSTLDARVCDLILRSVAMKENRLLLGTINGTERLTGWYPKGALVGDYAPIGGLLKEQIKGLAKYLGMGSLSETVSKDASKICSGCGELEEFKGIQYSTLDRLLRLFESDPNGFFVKGIEDAKVNKATLRKISARIETVRHKQDLFPEYCKIKG